VTEPLPKPAGPPGSTGPAGNATTSLIFDTGGIDLVAGQEYVIFVSLPANYGLYYPTPTLKRARAPATPTAPR
jgi:hypothetical protein